MRNPFKSKKKTYVDTQVVRVVEDTGIPDSMREGLIRALFRDAGVSETLVGSLLESPAIKFDRMHRYGRESYTPGLPNTNRLQPKHLNNIVKGVIEVIENRTVTIDYARYGALSNTHHARRVLTQSYGYEASTNEITTLSAQKGAKVYVKDIVPAYTEETLDELDPETLEPFGDPESGGYTEDDPLNPILGKYKAHTAPMIREFEGAEVIYTWRSGGQRHQDSLIVNMTAEDLTASYFQVQYHYLVSGSRRTRFWTYRDGAGEFPVLDALYNPGFQGSGSYFPFVFFRSERQDMTAEGREDTDLFKTSTKLLEHIGIDYQALGKEIDDNPDIGQIEQAVMVMGVRADSTDPLEIRYLFEYFRSFSILAGTGVDQSRPQAIVMQDRDFKQKLTTSSIARRRRSGRIGIVGTYASFETTREYQQPFATGGGGVDTRNVITRRFTHKSMVYRKQTTNTTYEEVWVRDPRLVYQITSGHSVTATLGEDRLLVPIDKQIADSFPIGRRERLYLRSLHLVFNSKVTQTVKWYQRGAFKYVLVIAAIAFAFYTGRFEAIAAAIAAGTLSSVALAVITEIVVALAMQVAFEVVAQQFGAEIAMYLAVAAMLYGGTRAIQAGTLNNAAVTEMLQVSTGLSNAAGNEYARQALDYQGQLEAFNLEAQEAMQELEELRKSMETLSPLNPFEFIGMQPFVVLGESPDNFYQRTVHSGNIGAKAVDAITYYAETALRLPTPQDSLGDVVYV